MLKASFDKRSSCCGTAIITQLLWFDTPYCSLHASPIFQFTHHFLRLLLSTQGGSKLRLRIVALPNKVHFLMYLFFAFLYFLWPMGSMDGFVIRRDTQLSWWEYTLSAWYVRKTRPRNMLSIMETVYGTCTVMSLQKYEWALVVINGVYLDLHCYTC